MYNIKIPKTKTWKIPNQVYSMALPTSVVNAKDHPAGSLNILQEEKFL